MEVVCQASDQRAAVRLGVERQALCPKAAQEEGVNRIDPSRAGNCRDGRPDDWPKRPARLGIAAGKPLRRGPEETGLEPSLEVGDFFGGECAAPLGH